METDHIECYHPRCHQLVDGTEKSLFCSDSCQLDYHTHIKCWHPECIKYRTKNGYCDEHTECNYCLRPIKANSSYCSSDCYIEFKNAHSSTKSKCYHPQCYGQATKSLFCSKSCQVHHKAYIKCLHPKCIKHRTKGDYCDNHTGCKQCSKPIRVGFSYCTDDCRTKFESRSKCNLGGPNRCWSCHAKLSKYADPDGGQCMNCYRHDTCAAF